jgi:heat shock protein HslJ
MNRTRAAGLTAILVALVLTACSSPQGGTDVSGKWGSTDPGQPNLIINADGSYSGSDGCNTMTGKGTISGNTIELGTAAMTQKECTDVNTWLSKAAKGTVDGNVMTVFDSAGTTIGRLDRDD